MLNSCYDSEQEAKAVSWYSRMEIEVVTEDFGQDPAPEMSARDQFAAALDGAGGENSQQTQTPEPQPEAPSAPAPEDFGGHPAFKPIAEKLGPLYTSIEPDLREISKSFEGKIADQNRKLDPWKRFEGTEPERVAAAWTLAQRIDSDPLGFYHQLEGFLRQNGLIEEAKQVAAAAEQVAGGENEPDPDEDPRIAQLQSQIEQLTQGQTQWMQVQQAQYEQQQREVATQQEFDAIGQELQALEAQGADKATLKEVIDRAELSYYRTGQKVPLSDIYRQVQADRAAILNQPRPVDRAPRLPGVSGGAPSQPMTDLSSATREQSRDTLAALIQAELAKGR